MNAFFSRILAYPRTVLVLLLMPTIFFASALPKLQKETDALKMLPADHPAVISSDQIEEEFGIKESMLVGVVEKNKTGIYAPETLDFLYRLTEKLKNTEGIETESVKGIFTVDDIVGTAEGFEVVPLLGQSPRSEEKIRQLRQRVADNGMLQGELVSKDGTGTLIYADPIPDADEAALYYEILDFVKSENKDLQRDVLIAGPPVVSGIMGVYVDQDLRRMFPVTGLVVVVMLALLLRSIRGILIPLFVQTAVKDSTKETESLSGLSWELLFARPDRSDPSHSKPARENNWSSSPAHLRSPEPSVVHGAFFFPQRFGLIYPKFDSFFPLAHI